MPNEKLTRRQKQGQLLKKLIKENGYTQENFGEEFGIEPRTVRKWIKMGIDSVDDIKAIADFFDMEFSDVLVLD